MSSVTPIYRLIMKINMVLMAYKADTDENPEYLDSLEYFNTLTSYFLTTLEPEIEESYENCSLRLSEFSTEPYEGKNRFSFVADIILHNNMEFYTSDIEGICEELTLKPNAFIKLNGVEYEVYSTDTSYEIRENYIF